MVRSTRNLHTVLFIVITCVMQTIAEDCPYTDPKCVCNFFGVECDDLQDIPPVNKAGNVRHGWILFMDGNITSMSKTSLPAGVSSIDVIRHPLSTISDDAFDASLATLTSVSIEGAKINRLPSALKKLTELKSLTIKDNPIEEWDTALLKQISETLEQITFKNVSLSAWPSWFSFFHWLQKTDLSWNSLKSIPSDAFKFIKGSLTELHLVGTGLTHVPQALSPLSNLTFLSLCNNSFPDVSEFKWITGSRFAAKLSTLFLDATGLTRIPNLSGLTNLNRISLTKNRIREIPVGSLPESLAFIDISDNRISSVPNALASLSRLKYLRLSSNLITVIEPTSLPSSLTSLDIQFNKLTIISNTTFKNLNNLNFVYLDSNPISAISTAAFSALEKLEVLGIKDVHLTNVPLALTLLNRETMVHFTTTRSLSCPCPVPDNLVQWFQSLKHRRQIQAKCSSGEFLSVHLEGRCRKP